MVSELNEALKIAGVRSPAIVNNTQALSSVVDMSLYQKVMAILNLGDMANETVDFSLRSSNAISGGALTGTVTTRLAATQLAANASANDNKQIILELDSSQLGGDRYLDARAITGGATGGVAGILIFGEPYYTSQSHIASVVQVKNG
jgi:hypothetical protein